MEYIVSLIYNATGEKPSSEEWETQRVYGPPERMFGQDP